MKKMITSAGLVVVGAATLQAQYAPAPGLTSFQTTKPWSVSASLRGFYDDNYVTRPSHSPSGLTKRDSFGFEVSPSIGYNLTLPQTYIGLNYTYGLKYYDDRPNHKADHSHQASVMLKHAFTELYKLDVSDTFVSSQEPELLQPGTLATIRVNGTGIHNAASANFTAGLTDRLSTVLGYSNNYYDYDQDAPVGSVAALLNRMEHLGTINLRWQAQPNTIGILGYQYGINEYDDTKFLGSYLGFPLVPSSVRDNTSHYIYLGVDQTFTPELNGSVRVGAQITEYDNISDQDSVSPYADANATWTYNPGNYVLLGVRHSRVATDVNAFSGNNIPTLDQEATTIYASVNHKITPKLTGSLLAHFQHGEFKGGGIDSETENIFLAGLNLSYEINKFLSADAGYNFDRLDSDIPDRSFSRNRIYIGIRATY